MKAIDVKQLATQVWSAGDMYIGPSIESLESFAQAIRNAALEEAARLVDETTLPDCYSQPCIEELAKEILALKGETK